MSATTKAAPGASARAGASGGLLPATSKAAFENAAEFCFKGAQAGVEQLPLRHDDHVEAWRKLVTTENLSNQSFSSISFDRAPELAGRGNPQTCNRHRIPKGKERQVPTMNLLAPVVYDLVLRPAPNALNSAQASHGFPGRPVARSRGFGRPGARLLRADGQPLAALGTTAFQDETAVLGAHSNEKSVHTSPAARVRLKCPFSLHVCSGSRTVSTRPGLWLVAVDETNREC